MARHPVDHRAPPQGGRIRHFLRLARGESSLWDALRRRPVAAATNRRLVEFLRIDRGRQA